MTENDLNNKKSKVWQTDLRTDKAGCIVACTRLKNSIWKVDCQNPQNELHSIYFKTHSCLNQIIKYCSIVQFQASFKFATVYWILLFCLFLVACTRLYDLLCPSVGRSVGCSVTLSFFSSFCIILSHFQ